ncbi:efflux RND transporter periplasmic adaptor subunit [Cereibacter changlensis JA139]|uniref:Efflux RND transporter periplasmic adaptor subunit n=2 Tax=Cereibacter changlensis TaxID=402884 RepID=A0A2T4JR61_9RHOB|nr:efflux RND transporter periplasmic adaptor subunit [Cereibacter changlensis]PTE20395.1 efflux RND transporter periplasmic adaptor subunit [Cereibacter changlensis JA139]PZX48836.1 RND family efflux transporter MFP subunit [Cereibacter changlensis]
MTLARQALLTVVVALLVLVLWVLFVPAAQPVLARIGVLEPLARIGIVSISSSEAAQPARRGGGGGPVQVVAAEPEPRVMNDIVTAIGTAQAVRSVVLTPEVSGKVVRLHVGAGDAVEAGDPILDLDSEAASIALDRAELVRSDAEATVQRLDRLSSSGAVTDLQRQDAELALRTAELALRQAQFDLSQHRVTAPVAGSVGLLAVEEGDQVNPGDEVTQIDDRSSVIVNFRVPERVVGSLRIGAPVSATPLAVGGVEAEGRISAIDNRVDVSSRSLRVQAAIPNAEDRLRSGMAFSITLRLEGETHPAVDPLSVQWGSDGAFVWIARDGKASQLPVSILQRNSDSVLVRAEFQAGDQVVIEGVQALRPNIDVAPITRSAAPGAEPSSPKT